MVKITLNEFRPKSVREKKLQKYLFFLKLERLSPNLDLAGQEHDEFEGVLNRDLQICKHVFAGHDWTNTDHVTLFTMFVSLCELYSTE